MQKTYWTWLATGWPIIALSSFLLGWFLPDFVLSSFRVWLLWALAGWTAFKVGVSLEKLSASPGTKNLSFFIWSFTGFIVAFIIFMAPLREAPSQLIQASQSAYQIVILTTFGLAFCCFCFLVLKKMEDPSPRGVFSRNISMGVMALMSCSFVLFGWNVALSSQNDPKTVSGLWRERASVIHEYITGRLSSGELYHGLAHLEKTKNDLRPKMFFSSMTDPSLFMTGSEWCEANKKRFSDYRCPDLTSVDRASPMRKESDYLVSRRQ